MSNYSPEFFDDQFDLQPPPSDHVYEGFSSRQSREFRQPLDGLASDIRGLHETLRIASPLALDVYQKDIQGKSLPTHGLMGIKPHLFSTPEIATFVGVHEAVHIKLGQIALAPVLREAAPGYDELFHTQLVPRWIDGQLPFSYTEEYLRGRHWDELYPGWHGPHAVTMDAAKTAIHNYFSVVARDQVQVRQDVYGRGYLTHDSPAFRTWDKTLALPIQSPEGVNAKDSQKLSNVMLTGYQLAETLRHYSRDNEPLNNGIWEMEENYANFVASELTGVPMEATQALAPQDEGKMRIARRLQENKVPVEKALEQVIDYRTLSKFVLSHI